MLKGEKSRVLFFVGVICILFWICMRVCVCVFEISVCAGVLGAGGLRSEAKRELCG